MLGKLVVELLGMIGLTWVVLICNVATDCVAAPGVFVAVYIYAWRPRTFAHLNPAVSLAYFTWNCDSLDDLPRRAIEFSAYVLTQYAGAVIGGVFSAIAIRYTLAEPEISIVLTYPHRMVESNLFMGAVTEGIATFFFILVVLRVVCFFENEKNQFGEIVIGISYTMAFWTSQLYSGGGINSAVMAGVAVGNRVLNPQLMQNAGTHLMVYYLGTLIGTLAAIGMHILLHYAKPPKTEEEAQREIDDNVANRKYTEIFQKYAIAVVE